MNTYEDPQIAQQKALAQALLSRGMNPQSVDGHYRRTNQAADLVSALSGAFGMYQANKRQSADDEAYRKTIADALAGPQTQNSGLQGSGYEQMADQPDPNEHLIKTLAGNKRTAPMALEFALKQRMGGGGTPAEMQVFDALTKDMSPADRERARRIHLGLEARPSGGSEPQEVFGNPVDELDESGQPVRVQYGNRGTIRKVPGAKPAPKRGGGLVQNEDGSWSLAPGGKLTEGEGKSVTYGVRAAGAMKTLDELEDTGYDPSNAADRFANVAPGGNLLKGPSAQKYGQAELEFLGAILRKDTGAAVTKEEIDIYGKMFFPRFGDSAEVRKQKREARHRAYEALKSGAGSAGGLIPNDAGAPAAPAEDDPLGLR